MKKKTKDFNRNPNGSNQWEIRSQEEIQEIIRNIQEVIRKIKNILRAPPPCRRPPFLEALWFRGVVVKGFGGVVASRRSSKESNERRHARDDHPDARR